MLVSQNPPADFASTPGLYIFPQPTHLLFVSGVPEDTLTRRLKLAFAACGELKDIFVTFQAKHGARILAFQDIRHSLRAHRAINMPSRSVSNTYPQARFIASEELDVPLVQNSSGSHGKPEANQAEFFDATGALGIQNGSIDLGEHVRVEPYPITKSSSVESEAEAHGEECTSTQQGVKNTIPFPTTAPPRTSRRLSIDSSLPSPSHDTRHGQSENASHPRRVSNKFHFDGTGKQVVLPTPPRPRSISDASDNSGLGLVDVSVASDISPSPSSAGNEALPQFVPIPFPDLPRNPPEDNRIDIARIEQGDDTRTTVMIKNIPNKMTRDRLLEFIYGVCPCRIDFLYLRVDFSNGCNAGYAFVNFIHVQDLLHFIKAKLGKKWNFFSSEKSLGMRYAKYQGKEVLVKKFRSSSIMDQREEWRPKLFYSSGPMLGLPQDFPAGNRC